MPTPEHAAPLAVNLLQLRAYIDRHIEEGRGLHIPVLDQRGLGFIRPEHHGRIAFGIPVENETHDATTCRVFIRGIY